jgi:hypothetical protein
VDHGLNEQPAGVEYKSRGHVGSRSGVPPWVADSQSETADYTSMRYMSPEGFAPASAPAAMRVNMCFRKSSGSVCTGPALRFGQLRKTPPWRFADSRTFIDSWSPGDIAGPRTPLKRVHQESQPGSLSKHPRGKTGPTSSLLHASLAEGMLSHSSGIIFSLTCF